MSTSDVHYLLEFQFSFAKLILFYFDQHQLSKLLFCLLNLEIKNLGWTRYVFYNFPEFGFLRVSTFINAQENEFVSQLGTASHSWLIGTMSNVKVTFHCYFVLSYFTLKSYQPDRSLGSPVGSSHCRAFNTPKPKSIEHFSLNFNNVCVYSYPCTLKRFQLEMHVLFESGSVDRREMHFPIARWASGGAVFVSLWHYGKLTLTQIIFMDMPSKYRASLPLHIFWRKSVVFLILDEIHEFWSIAKGFEAQVRSRCHYV